MNSWALWIHIIPSRVRSVGSPGAKNRLRPHRTGSVAVDLYALYRGEESIAASEPLQVTSE